MSDFDVKIVHGVEEIGQEAWDYLSGGRPFASYRWYRFGEMVLADDTPVYIVLSQKGEPIARATFWITRQEPLPISAKMVRRLIETLLRRWPALLCRSAWRSGTSGLILPDPPLRDAALRTITQVAWDQARQHRVSFLAFDYLEHSDVEGSSWPQILTPAKFSSPGTCLPITWPNFESYLKYLSKSAQKDYRRHRNRAVDLRIQVRRHPTVTSLDEAMVLIRNVEEHHHSSPDPWARLALENASRVDATWLTAEMDGRLVGCGLVVGEERTRFLTLLGLDYNVQYAYFQLMYEAIHCAIDEGVRVLRAGSGSYEIKQRLGFQLEQNNYAAFAANNRVLRWIGRRLSAS